MADELDAAVTLLAPDVAIEVAKAATEQDLIQQFARLAQTDSRFQIIVVIGHSNEFGLQLTSDRQVSWNVFAKWLQPFKPKQLVLIACKAGQIAPVESLFEEIPTLTHLYASPFVTTKHQVQAIKVLVPYLLNVRAADSDLIRLGQLANFFLTQGTILRWLRADFRFAKTRLSRNTA